MNFMTCKSGAGNALRSVWRALESVGRKRARADMNVVAELYRHSRPELARVLRSAAGRRAPA